MVLFYVQTLQQNLSSGKSGRTTCQCKTRLGFKELSEWEDWLTHIFKQDIANLSIHLRTREEMSQVDAHWELIPEIKNYVTVSHQIR